MPANLIPPLSLSLDIGTDLASLPVVSAHLLRGDIIQIDDEIMEVMLDCDSNFVIVHRGQEGTTAAPHAASSPISLLGNRRAFLPAD